MSTSLLAPLAVRWGRPQDEEAYATDVALASTPGHKKSQVSGEIEPGVTAASRQAKSSRLAVTRAAQRTGRRLDC
jgi:hypothetical protein